MMRAEFLLGLLLLVSDAHAARTRSFTGKVISLTPDTVTVQGEAGTLELGRRALGGESLRVGDVATFQYRAEAEGVKILERGGRRREEPGVAPTPSPDPGRGVPPGVVDDRAFYNAARERGDEPGESRADGT
jgi:hypothetical protein